MICREPQYPFVNRVAPLGVATTVYSLNTPVSPTPWVEMGWGNVGPELAANLAAALDSGEAHAKPPEAVAYKGRVQSAREAYWAEL